MRERSEVGEGGKSEKESRDEEEEGGKGTKEERNTRERGEGKGRRRGGEEGEVGVDGGQA